MTPRTRLLAFALCVLAVGCREQICRDPSFIIEGDRCVCPANTEERDRKCVALDAGVGADALDADVPADTDVHDSAMDSSNDVTEDASDSDVEDVGPPPPSPELVWPPNSYQHAGASAELAWHSAATVHEIQLDNSCSRLTCAFPSPEVDTRVAEPPAGGITATTVTLPLGSTPPIAESYSWRVRGCRSSICGPWSSTRFFVVGQPTGDVNGDGIGDLVVGAPFEEAGVVYSFHGREAGLRATPTTRIPSPVGEGGFGRVVANLGDVNGDGFSDVGVGVPVGKDRPMDDNEGVVYLYFGSAEGLSASPDVRLSNPRSLVNGTFGVAVVGTDLNADGLSEIIVGCGGQDEVYVFDGRRSVRLAPDTTLLVEQSTTSISAGGDINRDGFLDFVVGAGEPLSRTVKVFFGGEETSPGPSLSNGSTAGDFFGDATAISDLNHDFFSDVAVGAPRFSNPETHEGAVFLFWGKAPEEAAWLPDVMLDSPLDVRELLFGSVLVTSDINDDGIEDLAVGSSRASFPENREGNVFVFMSDDSGPPITPTHRVDNPRDEELGGFGSTLASIDINGDQIEDILVGALGSDDSRGSVVVLPGTPDFDGRSMGRIVNPVSARTQFGYLPR